jgi:spore coat protein U-like protein
LASCQVSAPATAFGTYSASGTNATSSVSVNCTNPTPYDVSYSTSQAPNATATKRNTDGPASDSLGHVRLSNSAYNVNWGRSAGAYAMPGTACGFSHPYAGYGQAAGAQPVAPGAFADSVMITVTY